MTGKQICELANFITKYRLTEKEACNLVTYNKSEYVESREAVVERYKFWKYVDFVLENDPYEIRVTATYDKDTGHFAIFDIWWVHSYPNSKNEAYRSEVDTVIKKFIKTHYPQLYNDAINIGGLTYLNLSNHDDGDM